MSDYAAFLEKRSQLRRGDGIEPRDLPPWLFGFQRQLVEWALARGRTAIFADCGLGKTPMQLVWADRIVRATGKRVLILTPLAVSHQTIAEAHKFDIEAHRVQVGELHAGINVTNYERLHYYNPADFVGVVADESSILKNFDGTRKAQITQFLRKMPYRLLATATAAPNDYVELGTSSEALGELGYVDMLHRFFKSDSNTYSQGGGGNRLAGHGGVREKFRFKGHAEQPFWRWVSSWARALRCPSDFGFPDEGFVLPPLIERQHVVEARTRREGTLFDLPAQGLDEQREERRRTIVERCEMVAQLVAHDRPALVWCHGNDEGKRLARMIPDAVEVAGCDSDDEKEARLLAFARGDIRVLVTKPKIGAWGLNFQHCAHVTFFPSHSFEQYYQGVRRCWRFGQTQPVIVDVVTTVGESNVMANLQRKALACDAMFSNLVSEMGHALHLARAEASVMTPEVPAWLTSPTATRSTLAIA